MSNEFTPDQIQDYIDFERVRSSNRYNMFDPRARQSIGLGKEEYAFVMKNFEALQAQQQAEDAHILAQADALQDAT